MGNWVNVGDEGFNRVYQLYDDHVNGWSIEMVDPIPISPNILLSCGFVLSGYNMLFWVKDNISLAGINWADADIPEYQFVNFGWGSNENQIISIRYLHQLQNLYYALTGEELTVPDPATPAPSHKSL